MVTPCYLRIQVFLHRMQVNVQFPAAFSIIHIQFNNLFAVVKNLVYQLMDQDHPGINMYESVMVFWVWENQNP